MTTTIRITLVLERDDNPPLFDELARLPKGPRRVNRLRTLALTGLLLQHDTQATAKTQGTTALVNDEHQAASVELFGPSVDAL